jgi:hypothetical protein
MVIGGGVAGLTAAAAALLKGAQVTLIESEQSLLPLQGSSRHRYIHPYVYDWPNEEAAGQNADLPVLSWTAGIAAEVAATLERKWAALSAPFRNQLGVHLKVRQAAISSISGQSVVNWSGETGPQAHEFRIVILAVGFGLEEQAPGQTGYWNDLGIDELYGRTQKKRWLVSGTGDGALTDLMRLCIFKFRHEAIIEQFAERKTGLQAVREQLQRIEAHPNATQRQYLTKAYQEINDVEVQDVLLRLRRMNTDVFLTGRSPYLYGPESNTLNKFIVSQLARVNAFTYISRQGVREPQVQPDGGYQVRFVDGSSEAFDGVILRHGPRPALKAFPAIWAACGPTYETWQKKRHNLDDTCKRMWPYDYWPNNEEPPIHVPSASTAAAKETPMTVQVAMPKRFDDDLHKLDGVYEPRAVINQETVILIVGHTLMAELLDRSIAEALRDRIDERGGQYPYRRGVIVTDVLWTELSWLVEANGVIAVGGPKTNSVTEAFINAQDLRPSEGVYPMASQGSNGFFRKNRAGRPHVALWGQTTLMTKTSVEIYLSDPIGLETFLRMCWPQG